MFSRAPYTLNFAGFDLGIWKKEKSAGLLLGQSKKYSLSKWQDWDFDPSTFQIRKKFFELYLFSCEQI